MTYTGGAHDAFGEESWKWLLLQPLDAVNAAAHAGAPAPGQESRRRVATVLAALCVLALVAVVALVLWLRAQDQERQDAEQDRIAVLQAAERFTETWNTFTAGEAEEYVERVAPLLSTKFRTEFTEGCLRRRPGDRAAAARRSTGEVLVDGDAVPWSAISTIDDDSAEVLVVVRRRAGRRRPAGAAALALAGSLVKVDGEWLVDDFEEV